MFSCSQNRPYTVLGRPAAARALQAGARQYAPQRGPSDVYAFTLPEQLAQMCVIRFRVADLARCSTSAFVVSGVTLVARSPRLP